MSNSSPLLDFVLFLPGFCDKLVKFCTNFANTHQMSNTKTMWHIVLTPIVGKDLEEQIFMGFVLGVLEGLIYKGFF